VSAARAAGATEQGLMSAFYQRGRIRFEPIERARPYLAEGALLMERVGALVERAPEPSTPWVQEALATARQWGRSTRDTARRATTLLEILPDFLGRGDRRRYLLAFQTPGEARGTGGLMGFYGVLGVTDGRVRLERLGSVQELMDEPITGVQAPGWFRRRYRLAGSFDYWQQANLSPNFPVVARVWLQMYRSTTGESLDGVLAMDPIALGHLLHATGPLRAKGIDVTVGPHNAKDVLLRDSYVNFGEDTEAQRNYIERLIRQFWHRLAEGAIDPAALAQGTAESVRTKHFKVYTRADDDDDELRELGVDGDYTALGPNLQLIFHNSYASNKVDYFLEQRIHTSVRLASSGTADVTTTTVLDNRAPSAPSSSLLGPGQIKSDTVGINRSTLEFLLPRGAKVRSFAVEGKRVRPVVDYEAGFPVAWKLVEVPAGKSKRVTVSYTIPEALTPPQDGSDFSMSLVPQTTVNPPSFSLTVVPPYGYELEPVQGATTTSGGIRTSGILDQEQTLRARLRAR
jgi:hypothetical protein